MKTRYRHAHWVVLAALCANVPAQAQTAADLIVRASGNAPVITLAREHGMVKTVADTPLLSLYADGHVAVHIPAYMKGAGHYEYQLERAEFGNLMRDLDAAGLMRFDAKAAQARHAAAATSRQATTGVRYITTDSTTTRIGLNFASFGSTAGTPASVTREIEWPDLAVQAERYPQLDEVVALAAVEKRLLTLASDSRRRPVKAPTRQ